jgi:hypothetical protein
MNLYDQDRFVGAMIAEGFDPSPHHPRDLFEPARLFARLRAEDCGASVFAAEFRSGTYVERPGLTRWFEGLSKPEALRRLGEDPDTYV